MRDVALGFRTHSGWTALVALCLEKSRPQVLVRQRPELVEEFTYKFRQPYHTAERLPLDKARDFISRIESAAIRLAEETIRNIQADLRGQGYELRCFGLPLASARPLPNLEKILLSHALIHTADGELFRRAVICAGERCKIAPFSCVERELVTTACKTFKTRKDDLLGCLTALGKSIGPPWSQDEKYAALTAWLALHGRVRSTAKPANTIDHALPVQVHR